MVAAMSGNGRPQVHEPEAETAMQIIAPKT